LSDSPPAYAGGFSAARQVYSQAINSDEAGRVFVGELIPVVRAAEAV
jgi:hypothetical protein